MTKACVARQTTNLRDTGHPMEMEMTRRQKAEKLVSQTGVTRSVSETRPEIVLSLVCSTTRVSAVRLDSIKSSSQRPIVAHNVYWRR